MMLHHFISLTSLVGCLYMGRSGAEVVSTLWGSEVTNPFLQVRWFLRETGQYDTVFAFINDCVFVGMFAFVRVVIGSYLAYCMYYSKKTHILMKLGGYSFFGISVIWTYLILQFFRKRVVKWYGTRSKIKPSNTEVEEYASSGCEETLVDKREV